MRAPLSLSSLLPLVLLAGCDQEYEVVPTPVDVNPGDVTECGFTRVDDTAFYRYDCNPVFSATDEDWADTIRGTTFLVTEVLGHPFYQMWYTGVKNSGAEGEFGFGYAVSADGTEWTPSPENPLLTQPEDRSAWDADAMDGMVVVWDSTEQKYVLLYQGYDLGGDLDWGLGVAVSQNGQNWKRIESNPVMNLQEGIGPVQSWCWPLGLSLGEVAGYTGYVAGMRTNRGACEAYRINASNVNNWEPDTEVVLPAGDRGDWDDTGFIGLSVAELAGKRHMFYVGFGDWVDSGDNVISAVNAYLGMATWENGEWVKEPTPIPINMTEDGEVSAVAANTVGSRIHLWVTDNYDGDQAVGYFLYDPDAAAAEDAGGDTAP